MGRAVRAHAPTACPTSDRTGTFPHHLFAFGDSSHGVTGAYLASRMLLRHHLDELEPADRHFGFTRHGG